MNIHTLHRQRVGRVVGGRREVAETPTTSIRDFSGRTDSTPRASPPPLFPFPFARPAVPSSPRLPHSDTGGGSERGREAISIRAGLGLGLGWGRNVCKPPLQTYFSSLLFSVCMYVYTSTSQCSRGERNGSVAQLTFPSLVVGGCCASVLYVGRVGNHKAGVGRIPIDIWMGRLLVGWLVGWNLGIPLTALHSHGPVALQPVSRPASARSLLQCSAVHAMAIRSHPVYVCTYVPRR